MRFWKHGDPQARDRRNEEVWRRDLWLDCERNPHLAGLPPQQFAPGPRVSLFQKFCDYMDGY